MSCRSDWFAGGRTPCNFPSASKQTREFVDRSCRASHLTPAEGGAYALHPLRAPCCIVCDGVATRPAAVWPSFRHLITLAMEGCNVYGELRCARQLGAGACSTAHAVLGPNAPARRDVTRMPGEDLWCSATGRVVTPRKRAMSGPILSESERAHRATCVTFPHFSSTLLRVLLPLMATERHAWCLSIWHFRPA